MLAATGPRAKNIPQKDFTPKDVPVTLKNILSVWQCRKLSHEVAKRDAVACRQTGSDRFVNYVNWVEEQESEAETQRLVRTVLMRMEDNQAPFRHDPRITEWKAQFQESSKLRYRVLLLRGPSCCGKTRKAVSLFGALHVYMVNCQGLGDKIPSLRFFDRAIHHGVVWDEASHQQVLANKLVFQSGPEMITLGQSGCNQFAYKRWFFAVPMVLCSNTFATSRKDDPKMSPEDEQWLQENIDDVRLEPGMTWFLQEPEIALQSGMPP